MRATSLPHVPKYTYSIGFMVFFRDKWVPVTTAWRVLRLRMQERPSVWKVAANRSNKQSRTANKGWYSGLVVG